MSVEFFRYTTAIPTEIFPWISPASLGSGWVHINLIDLNSCRRLIQFFLTSYTQLKYRQTPEVSVAIKTIQRGCQLLFGGRSIDIQSLSTLEGTSDWRLHSLCFLLFHISRWILLECFQLNKRDYWNQIRWIKRSCNWSSNTIHWLRNY